MPGSCARALRILKESIDERESPDSPALERKQPHSTLPVPGRQVLHACPLGKHLSLVGMCTSCNESFVSEASMSIRLAKAGQSIPNFSCPFEVHDCLGWPYTNPWLTHSSRLKNPPSSMREPFRVACTRTTVKSGRKRRSSRDSLAFRMRLPKVDPVLPSTSSLVTRSCVPQGGQWYEIENTGNSNY